MRSILVAILLHGYEQFNGTGTCIYSGVDAPLEETSVGVYYIVLKAAVFLSGIAMTLAFGTLAINARHPEKIKEIKSWLERIGIVSALIFAVTGLMMLIQEISL